MKSIFKKSLLIAVSCFITTATWAQVSSFTAAEIKAGTTKGTVSVSTTLNVVNKQMCKENGKAVKIDAIEGGNTANTVNDNYVQISSTSDISKLVFHATYNSSGSGKKMACVCWGDGVTPAIENVLTAQLITFVGYDGACDNNYTEVTLPAGVRMIRIYRQLKKFDGNGAASSNYGDGTTFFIADVDVTAGPAPKSKDATLSDLKVDGTTIAGFSPATTTYSYSVAATATTAPVISATKNDSKASDPVITQPAMPTAGNPTTGTVKVTAEDGTTSQTYTITFTRAELSHDATLKDIQVDGRSISGFSATTKSYSVDVPYTQTTIPVVTATVNNSGAKAEVTQASAVEGTATIVVTAEDGSTKETYTITFKRVAASNDATLSALTYDGKSVTGFSANKTDYNVELQEGSAVPVVSATANHPFAQVAIEQPKSTNDKATVTVTAEDGTTKKTYTITFEEIQGVPVPPTSLTIHVPELYEARERDGGYAAKLTIYQDREYEVYYANRDADGKVLSITTVPGDRQNGIEDHDKATSTYCKTRDGWAEATVKSVSGGTSAKAGKAEEFGEVYDEWRVGATSIALHVKGYDRFNFYGADKNVEMKDGAFKKDQRFQVFIDGVMQPEDQCSTTATVRHYDISVGEHLIEVKGMSGGECNFYGFSLRVAEVPRVKHIIGNDSTQTVLQTTAPRRVLYFTKYASKGETKIIWDGPEATGLTLSTKASSAIGDTLILSGAANCPIGEYNFHVAALYNGKETSSVPGHITVISQIVAQTDTVVDAFQGEEMEELRFHYYALSPSDVKLQWANDQAPTGISGSGKDGIYTISGVPNVAGPFPVTYKYSISVPGSKVITGKIVIRAMDLGNDPVLYLYKNGGAPDKDGVFAYLTSKGRNLIPRKAKDSGLRAADQYAKYKWILISEDADADNKEVLAVTRDGVGLPVLNMKAFSYAPERLDWGYPDNGSVSKNGCSLTVQRADHPIFQALGKKQGDKIQVLDTVILRGLMPTKVDVPGTLCLALSWTRSIDDYYKDGELQTVLHEIPSEMRGGKKYISLPIGIASSQKLTNDGKKLIDEVVKYLLGSQATIALPELQITSFKINGVAGTINQTENTIELEFDVTKYPKLDLSAVVPEVKVASTLTHVIPLEGKTVDFTRSTFTPIEYEVTDYINRRVYEVTVSTFNPQGLEETYTIGEWVNIYDIFGRKVATTNEDIYRMSLPHGVYVIVRENGETLKIMK